MATLNLKVTLKLELTREEGRLTKAMILEDVLEQLQEDIFGRLDGEYNWTDQEGTEIDVFADCREIQVR